MRNAMTCLSLLVSCLAVLAACSASVSTPSPQKGPTPTPPPAVGSGPVSGTIQGKAWAMVNGEAHPNQGTSGNLLQINLWPSASRQPCAAPDATSITDTQVYAYVKPAVGDTPVTIFSSDGTALSFDYMEGSTSTIDMASQGKVTLTSVTANQVVGSLTASAADGNAVSGQFTVTLCPY